MQRDTRRPAASRRPAAEPSKELLAQLALVSSEPLFAAAVDGSGDLTAVLNGRREVVYANRAFLELAGAAGGDGLCGGRPGEVLGCRNAAARRGGCGDSAACAVCGATAAVLETQRTGAPAVAEFHLEPSDGERRRRADFRVRTTPFEIGGERFTLLSLSDIGHEMRRSALERVFFHDVLNTVSGLKTYVDLLKATASDPRSAPLLEGLEATCAALVEELESQRTLLAAENGTLAVRRELVESLSLVRQVAEQYRGQDLAKGRSIEVAPASESAAFVSDHTLLRRAIGNMVKNALEAAPRGSAVTIGCARQPEGVRFWVRNAGAIAPEVQPQLFRRYFSTKGAGRGLGTYGMRLLGEEYLRGKVGFSSAAAEGTVFWITVPDDEP